MARTACGSSPAPISSTSSSIAEQPRIAPRTAARVHYGAAFTIEAHRNAWLRFEALHVILPSGTAGYANCFEAQLGVMTRFGRRD